MFDRCCIAATLVLIAFPVVAADEALSAATIVERATAHNAFGFANGVAHMRLLLSGVDKPDKQRNLDIYGQTLADRQCTLVRFRAPADIAGTAFLVRDVGTASEQYLYLPALGKTKRITGAQRDQKFAGTDFTYADIQAQNLRDAQLTRLADATIAGQPAFVIEATPRDAAVSVYGKIVTTVHQEAYIPLRVEFYDGAKKLLKVLTVQRLEKRDGHWVAMAMQIEDLQAQTKTRIVVDGIEFPTDLPARLCSPEALTAG